VDSKTDFKADRCKKEKVFLRFYVGELAWLTMARKSNETHVVRKFEVKTVQDVIPGTDTMDVLDIGACLSKTNHRLYRQGRVYKAKVSLDTRTMEDATATVDVWALAPTWWVRGAWHYAKNAYDEALADEKALLSAGNVARWRDFRVASGYLNAFEAGTLNPELYTITGTPPMSPAPYSAGEFNHSRVENLNTGVSMNFSWPSTLVSAVTEFDMLSEFNDSRNESESPQTIIGDMPYNELMSDANDDVYIELQANGNETPYNPISFEDFIWVRVGHLQAKAGTGNGWVSSTGFFDAPCGLVLINTTDDLVTKLSVEVAKGDYRGVHAEPM